MEITVFLIAAYLILGCLIAFTVSDEKGNPTYSNLVFWLPKFFMYVIITFIVYIQFNNKKGGMQ